MPALIYGSNPHLIQTALANLRPIPLIYVSAIPKHIFPSTFVLKIRKRSRNSSFFTKLFIKRNYQNIT